MIDHGDDLLLDVGGEAVEVQDLRVAGTIVERSLAE
jgi:hypothetical protein